ncbi:MAG: hypothetical protein FVQ82_10690 [Planctomycetes bacterium]|nr:hypothetical protein [Planctomycetota bacterium]
MLLTAFDGLATGEETVTITVYEDSCEAAKGEDPELPLQSDFNEDCITDLKDLAILAAQWIVNTAL